MFVTEALFFSILIDDVVQLAPARRILVIAWGAMITYGTFVVPYMAVLLFSVTPNVFDRGVYERKETFDQLYALMLRYTMWWGSGAIALLLVWHTWFAPEPRLFAAVRYLLAPLAAFVPTAIKFTNDMTYDGKAFAFSCLGVLFGIWLWASRM